MLSKNNNMKHLYRLILYIVSDCSQYDCNQQSTIACNVQVGFKRKGISGGGGEFYLV
jgi:hypothetical protein